MAKRLTQRQIRERGQRAARIAERKRQRREAARLALEAKHQEYAATLKAYKRGKVHPFPFCTLLEQQAYNRLEERGALMWCGIDGGRGYYELTSKGAKSARRLLANAERRKRQARPWYKDGKNP